MMILATNYLCFETLLKSSSQNYRFLLIKK